MPFDEDVWVADLDDRIDALSSPTSTEVMHVTDLYEASTGVAVAVRRALEGGGASPTYTQRASYGSGDNATIATGAPGNVPWGDLGSGEPLLDLSSPTAPTVVAGGIYSVTVVVAGAITTEGGYFHTILHLDRDNEDAVCEMDSRLQNGTLPFPNACIVSLNSTYYLPAGGVVGVQVINEDGAEDCIFYIQEAILQLLPGGP